MRTNSNQIQRLACQEKANRKRRGSGAFTLAVVFATLAGGSSLTAQSLTTLYNFPGGSEFTPNGLIAGPDKTLIGTTTYSGNDGGGEVFQMTPPAAVGDPWTEQVIYSLRPNHVGAELSGWLQFTSNQIFLTARYGGDVLGLSCPEPLVGGCGSVFTLTAPAANGGAWTESTLYQFQGGSDAAEPLMMVPGPGGVFYGAAYGGGGSKLCGTAPNAVNGCGAVFQLTPPVQVGGSWTESILYAFPGGSGESAHPNSLVLLPDGKLIGTTAGGDDFGDVFALTPPAQPGEPWTMTELYQFQNGNDGGVPTGKIFAGAKGKIYGLTVLGGAAGFGVFYAMTPPANAGDPWTETVLYSFQGGVDGTNPVGLTAGYNGTFFGTTKGVSAGFEEYSNATIFSLTPPAQPSAAWVEKVLYLFDSPTNEVYAGGVMLGPNHSLFGFTPLGGADQNGTVFQFTR